MNLIHMPIREEHGEVILIDEGKRMEPPSEAFWSVKQMLEGLEPKYVPVRVFRTKQHGIIWRFRNERFNDVYWWQTCNEDPVVAELMAAQFKKGMYGKSQPKDSK